MEKRIRKQLEEWRDSFINTAVKKGNNMLNQDPVNTAAIRLEVNEYFTYDSFWKIAVGQGKDEEYALRSKASTDPRYNPISWRTEKPTANPTDPAHLDELVKEGYQAIVQKGENPICITFGRVKWRVLNPEIKKSAGAEEFINIYTPLILIPIKMNKRGVNYWLKPVDEDAMINPALILKYVEEGYKPFPLPACGQWIDENAFDIVEYFESLEEYFAGNSLCSFEKDYVALDLFDYDRMCMYRDVSRHMDQLQKNKIIRALFGERIFAPGKVMGLDAIDPRTSFPILDTNTSQSNVIEKFVAGESFILEGPPGTGKTQTIVNMISEAIMREKKVLFVSGKMSALNTVVKKLQMQGVNIDKHCLLIAGEGEDKKISVTETYGKLQASYDAPRPVFDYADYEQNIKALKDARGVLVGYNGEFYDSDNSLGSSIYDIIGRMLLLGYNENHTVAVEFDSSFIEKLTKDDLEAYTQKIAEVEKLLVAIFKRSGSIEKDVWYGYRHYDIDYKIESELHNKCAEIGIPLREIKNVFASVTGGEEDVVDKLVRALLDYPLHSIRAVMQADVSGDLGYLYLKGSLGEEKRAIKAEMLCAEAYADAARRYYPLVSEEADCDGEELEKAIAVAGDFADKTVREVRKELEKIEYVSRFAGFRFTADQGTDDVSTEVLNGIVTLVEQYAEAVEKRDALHAELAENFTEDVFVFDYKPLLEKCRTSWEKNLKEDKKPLFFDLTIKNLKKCCKNAVGTDFSLRATYELLEKLDLYSQNKGAVDALKGELEKYGLAEISQNLSALKNLCGFLQSYIEERAQHELTNFLYEEISFREYLNKKVETLKGVDGVAKAIKLKVDITVKELGQLVADYKLVKANNGRIAKDEVIKLVFPSVKKNVCTDWASLLYMLDMIERVREVVRDENRTIQEDFAVFTQVIKALAGRELQRHINALSAKYEAFYANEAWFDKEIMGNAHDCRSMTYSDFEKWFAEVSDFNHVTEYVTYRRKVRDLDKYGRQFFDWYAKAGRKEYPLEKMRDNYEITILYAYYSKLVEKSKYVAKLSGKDGITTVASVVDAYAKADLKSIDYNRRILDEKLYSSITRSVSANGNLHNYLRAVPTGSNASVRRLFKNRSESIMELAPCLMMSVYSVSKLLEYEQYQFDVLIFDEASQVPAEDALTSIMRTKSQIVIAGDPKQMPAISYFESKGSGEHMDADEVDEETADCASIIDFVIRAQNSTIAYERLDMHYRSNHESLIKYSNEHPKLYGGNLVTFPSPKARTPDFGLWNYYVPDDPRFAGETIVGGGGENEAEAKVVIDLIKEHFRKHPVPTTEEEKEKYQSLGVIVFGTSQKKRILAMMEKDKEAAPYAGIKDTHIFFINTADEIQGDEMSEMILSLTYGRDPFGKISQSWGHLNQLPVALYKFNVAVTRARDNLKFVHSVKAGDVTNGNLSYVGEYLSQFEEFAKGQFLSHNEYNTKFVEAIGRICEEVVGKDRVVYNYGESPRSYRVPISILSADGQGIVMGVMCEVNRGTEKKSGMGASGGQGFSVREYSRTCKSILQAHDWSNLYETYAIQWIRNYAVEKKNLIERLKQVK
ncbi:MAG: hypothetical protein IJB34_01725 [Clostridia bacterium]|nr:hypothetical protein [Clostridia bacterium]